MAHSRFFRIENIIAVLIGTSFIFIAHQMTNYAEQVSQEVIIEVETVNGVASRDSYRHSDLLDRFEWTGEIIPTSNNVSKFEISEPSINSIIESAYVNKILTEGYSANYFDVNRYFLITQLATSSMFEGADQLDFYNFKSLYIADESGLLGTALPPEEVITQKNHRFTFYYNEKGNKVNLELGKEYLFISPFKTIYGNADGVLRNNKLLFVGFYVPLAIENSDDLIDTADINKVSFVTLHDTVSNVNKGKYEDIVLVSNNKYYSLGSVTENKRMNFLLYDKLFCYVNEFERNKVNCLDLTSKEIDSLKIVGEDASIVRLDQLAGKLILYVRMTCDEQAVGYSNKCLKIYVSNFGLSGDTDLIYEDYDGYEKGEMVFVSELSDDLSTAKIISNVSYECRQMYKEFIYDVQSRETVSLIHDLDNGCKIDNNPVSDQINDLRFKNIFNDRTDGNNCQAHSIKSEIQDIICF